jgi:hypothetical protein
MLNESGDGVLIGSTVRLEDNLIKNVIGERTSAAQAIAGKSSRSGSGNLSYTGKDDLNRFLPSGCARNLRDFVSSHKPP